MSGMSSKATTIFWVVFSVSSSLERFLEIYLSAKFVFLLFYWHVIDFSIIIVHINKTEPI